MTAMHHTIKDTANASESANDSAAIDFSTVLASMVHDMKNSLSMLLCSLDDVIADVDLPSESQMKLTQLQYEGQRVSYHLIQLLSIYKIENAQYAANITEVDMEEFVQEAAILHEEILAPKGIHIDTQSKAGLTAYIDREMVAGVINNVINNAYRYSKDQISINACVEDGYLRLSVDDNGAGYPENMLCENSNWLTGVDFNTGSTGLGLYFSSLVARLHNSNGKRGYIRCSNEGIDGGGRFSVLIPR